ncbi:hypothetical protein I7I53_07482 [Histoplasma capsulatum var. duboisii H88]|uniref:Uncharacterized protein n=1 Tax=Ajellomyces capsulatus (strain H88) TaxID=544711 RepID=A0A8A1LGE0_AJEC8|nr:hypothetical protein I7I53_07482 [Histoplasma capsulatum var. duboisii H88]
MVIPISIFSASLAPYRYTVHPQHLSPPSIALERMNGLWRISGTAPQVSADIRAYRTPPEECAYSYLYVLPPLISSFLLVVRRCWWCCWYYSRWK